LDFARGGGTHEGIDQRPRATTTLPFAETSRMDSGFDSSYWGFELKCHRFTPIHFDDSDAARR
jgi:hypothetical protein